ncbi:MAG: T9SS type A sorting domain-containing protein, partial [Bacteroidetes bacterium]|nr:T9SS type A sorting domain-containing protein [Bacteroidota bacterium]
LNSICSTNGVLVSMTTDISENQNEIIVAAQPNPFDENATVFFFQQTEQRVTIAIIDILGKEIQIANAIYPAGNNSINLSADALKLAKGVYIFKISSDKYTASLRLVKY